MKIGDLVRMADHEDDDVGVVMKVTQYEEDNNYSPRVEVFWGPEATFGNQVEWDWASDLEVVNESR